MEAILSQSQCINSLAPGKFELHFRYLIFQIISVINGWGISCELALRWTSLNITDDKSTLVQVMAWCRQATSHYLSQWWPRCLSPYGITRPQWVKLQLSTSIYSYCIRYEMKYWFPYKMIWAKNLLKATSESDYRKFKFKFVQKLKIPGYIV